MKVKWHKIVNLISTGRVLSLKSGVSLQVNQLLMLLLLVAAGALSGLSASANSYGITFSTTQFTRCSDPQSLTFPTFVLQGNPTRWRLEFDAAAKSAGLKDETGWLSHPTIWAPLSGGTWPAAGIYNATFYVGDEQDASDGNFDQCTPVPVKVIIPGFKSPKGVKVTRATTNSILLSWDPLPGATGYYLDVAAVSGNNYSQMLEGYDRKLMGDATVRQFEITGLMSDTQYDFRIYATNGNCLSEYFYYGWKTSGDAPYSVTYGPVAEEVTCNTATIVWGYSYNATQFNIYYSTDPAFPEANTVKQTVSNVNSHQISGLKANQKYYIRLTSLNSKGESNPVGISITTPEICAIAGPSEICEGSGSVKYTISATGATSYEWKVPSGWSIVSGQGTSSVTVSPNSGTHGHVEVKVTKSGKDHLIKKWITVMPTPEAPVVGTVIQPDCFNLTGSVVLNQLPANGFWRVEGASGSFYMDGTGSTATIRDLTPGKYRFAVTGNGGFGKGTGLRGLYFANDNLSGQPVLSRIDSRIDFNWGSGSPASAVPADNFFVLWRGWIEAPSTGSYQLSATADDGLRLYFNGQPAIEKWNTAGTHTFDVDMVAGRKYPITIEYHEKTGNAKIKLAWLRPNGTSETIPASSLYASLSSDCQSGLSSEITILPFEQTPAPVVSRIIQPLCSETRGSVVLANLPAGDWEVIRMPDRVKTSGSGTTATLTDIPPGNYQFVVVSNQASIEIPGDGLNVDYFNNMTLKGSPVATRSGQQINMSLDADESPVPGVVNRDKFSARWSGYLLATATGEHKLKVRVDDGFRLYINQMLVLSSWKDQTTTEYQCTVPMTKDRFYHIRLEYYENTGKAVAELSWQPPGASAFSVVPKSYLYSRATENCSSYPTENVTIELAEATLKPEIFYEGSLQLCRGDQILLTATEAASYLWSNGATTRSINVTQDGSYWVKIFTADGCESIASDLVTVNFGEPPVIIRQPESKTVCEHSYNVFIVEAQGSNLHYKWQHAFPDPQTGEPDEWLDYTDDELIEGVNSPNVLLKDVQMRYSGKYGSCVVTSNGCSVRTNLVRITVNKSIITNSITLE